MEQDDVQPDDPLKRKLIGLVTLAAEIADAVPKFSDRAFDKVLDYLLHDTFDKPESLTRSRKAAKEGHVGRRSPKANAGSMDRIKTILDAPPEVVAEFPDLLNLDAKGKIYMVLSIARERFGIDGLTIPEFRVVVNDKFRVGIPDGTIRGTLSTAPATEIGRATGTSKETIYKLLRPGEAYLKKALTKLASGMGSSDHSSDL